MFEPTKKFPKNDQYSRQIPPSELYELESELQELESELFFIQKGVNKARNLLRKLKRPSQHLSQDERDRQLTEKYKKLHTAAQSTKNPIKKKLIEYQRRRLEPKVNELRRRRGYGNPQSHPSQSQSHPPQIPPLRPQSTFRVPFPPQRASR